MPSANLFVDCTYEINKNPNCLIKNGCLINRNNWGIDKYRIEWENDSWIFPKIITYDNKEGSVQLIRHLKSEREGTLQQLASDAFLACLDAPEIQHVLKEQSELELKMEMLQSEAQLRRCSLVRTVVCA